MTNVTATPDRDSVLTAINELRAKLELSPLEAIPRGVPRSGMKCPIAQALQLSGGLWTSVLRTEWTIYRGCEIEKYERMPTILTAFICAFDKGEYPELINRD